MVDAAGSFTEVARQFWTMLNPLLANNGDKSGMSANVERHNGLEAWRRLAEFINEDNAPAQRDVLAAVTNPKGAASMDKIESAVEDWDTNIRLVAAANGEPPSEEATRMTLIQMIPIDISA